jgi:hypothetical protein
MAARTLMTPAPGMHLHRTAACLCLFALALLGCSGGEETSRTSGADQARYALRVHVALTDNGQGVDLIAQNGSAAYVPAADIIGKTAYWATTPGGEPVSGTAPIEFGAVVMRDDLTADVTTPAGYESGLWEMSMFISITEGELINGPQPGDLGAFDNTPPPQGEPLPTGSSVRMRVQGADAEVTLDNGHFVQF